MAGIEKDAPDDREELEPLIRKKSSGKQHRKSHRRIAPIGRPAPWPAFLGISEATVRASRLACPRAQKPHLVDTFKSQPRSAVHRKAGGHRWAVPSTTAGHRVFGGREESDSSFGSHPAQLADEEGPQGHHDPRLQARHGTTTLFAALNTLFPVWFSASAGLDSYQRRLVSFPASDQRGILPKNNRST